MNWWDQMTWSSFFEGWVLSQLFPSPLSLSSRGCLVPLCTIYHKGGVICISVQFSSVTQSCPALCDPMNCSTPGYPVHHQHPELAQTHVHRVSDAISSSAILFSSFHQPFPTLRYFPVSQFFIQHQSFEWIFRTDFIEDWLVWSPCSLRDSQVFSNITV